jgi:hypothetical protein
MADRSGFSLPISINRKVSKFFLNGMAQKEPERYDSLERAGFNVERYGDIAQILYERMGGHYMDVGTSAKISEGLVSDSNQVRKTNLCFYLIDMTECL